jgi:hypothetical protein
VFSALYRLRIAIRNDEALRNLKQLRLWIAVLEVGYSELLLTGPRVWRKEDLGTQTIEGVTVHGVRRILKVSASESGTGQPLEIFDEFWYSEECGKDSNHDGLC